MNVTDVEFTRRLKDLSVLLADFDGSAYEADADDVTAEVDALREVARIAWASKDEVAQKHFVEVLEGLERRACSINKQIAGWRRVPGPGGGR